MSMENLQAIEYATKPSINPFGGSSISGGVYGVGAIEKTQPVDVYSACEALSMKDGRSPDISGSACGAKLDIGKDGCIDNLAWGI